MPPRHPCPHCPEFFVTNQVLQTHIHFVHNNGASQPPRPKPLIWTPPSTIAGREEANTVAPSLLPVARPSREDHARVGNASNSAATANAEGDGYGEYMSSLRRREVLREATVAPAQPGLNILSTGVRTSGRPWDPETLRFLQKQLPINEATTPMPTPRPGFRRPPLRNMTNSIESPIAVRQEMRPAELQAGKFETQRRRSASPERLGIPVNLQARKFGVVYECQEARVQQRLEVPTTTPWQSFTALLQGASAPVAGAYIAGRTTGFTLEDGPWRYAFVNYKSVREDRWRVLTSNLLYQAMISELMTHSAIWRHALVCHEKQIVSSGRLPGAEGGDGSILRKY